MFLMQVLHADLDLMDLTEFAHTHAQQSKDGKPGGSSMASSMPVAPQSRVTGQACLRAAHDNQERPGSRASDTQLAAENVCCSHHRLQHWRYQFEHRFPVNALKHAQDFLGTVINRHDDE